jgi:glycolate oxidase FAD binding subunit
VTELVRPAAEWELQTVIAKLAAQNVPVEIVGHGALRNAGRHIDGIVARRHAVRAS